MTRTRLPASSMLLVALACGGEPIGPRDSVSPTATRIEVGDTVVQVFAVGDTIALFTIQPSEAVELTLFVQAEANAFGLTISDSLTEQALGFGAAPTDASPDHLTLRRSDVVSVQAGQVLLVRVRSFQPGSPGRLRVWVYPIHRAPEVLPSSIAIGDTLEGEDLVNSADIDDFLFDASAGAEFIAYIQGVPGVVPGGLALRVLSPAGDQVLAGATNGAGDVELDAQPTGRFVTSVAGKHRLAVGHFGVLEATTEFPGTGSYRVLLRRIDRQPEDVPAVLTPGDTLAGERIDFVGDVDEFQVPIVADSIYNLFLQTLASSDPADLQVTAHLAGSQIALAFSSAGDSALAGQFSGNFTAPASGVLTVRVVGQSDGQGLDRGPYRLFAYPVDRAPELAPAGLTAGDSVTETIEYPGDIDEFTLAPPSTGVVNLILRRSNARDEWLDLIWLQGSERVTLNCYPRQPGTESGCGSGRLSVSGPLPLTVASQLGATTGFRGAYRLVTLPIDTMPDGRPQQVAIGDVIAEALDPVGDMDVYDLTYSAGDLIELEGTGGVGTSSADSFILLFVNPDGDWMPGYTGNVSGATGRFTLPSSGNYRIQILGASSGQIVTESGPYTLAIKPVGSAAENVSSPLTPGDSVTTESTDTPGDVDDFTISAPAGTEVVAFVRGTFRLLIDAVIPGTGTLIRSGANFNVGRLTVPASGQIGLRVYEQRSFSSGLQQSGFGFTGPYSIAVHQIDRAPETLGAVVTLGTTMDGEALDVEGDVDEFTFPGAAGQQVTGSISAPFALDRGSVMLEIVDPANGNVLGTASSFDATVVSTGPVSLPATRTYLVRMRSPDSTEGKGGYRFAIE